MDRSSRCRQQEEGIWPGSLRVVSLPFADEPHDDLQRTLERLLGAGMRISPSKAEAMRVGCSLRIRDGSLPQVEEFKCLGSYLWVMARLRLCSGQLW